MVSKSRKNAGRGAGRPSLEDVIGRVDDEVRLLRGHLGGLPRAVEADQILRSIWIDDVHNSTAIEGNTLTRAQVEELVQHRKVNATLREMLEVRAYANAADWVYRNATDYEHVPLTVVREVHKIAMELVWAVDPPVTNDAPGAWRRTGVNVRDVRVSLPAEVPMHLADWSESTKDRTRLHPIARAAKHHAWFERIHPFVDGNGRVGRLLLNFMLVQSGYPPAIILATQRARYLQALRKADEENYGPISEAVARATSHALTRFLIPGLAGDAKLIPLTALAASGPYSPAYLRQLVLANRLRAIRDGNLWLSSRAWLADYIRNRDPRGGPVPTPKRSRARGAGTRRISRQGELPLDD
jgi:fido (protein-threonine AMPylation protein)